MSVTTLDAKGVVTCQLREYVEATRKGIFSTSAAGISPNFCA